MWTMYYKGDKVTQKISNNFKIKGIVVFEGRESAVTIFLQFGNWATDLWGLPGPHTTRKTELTK